MIADSLTNNNSIRSFQLVDYELEQSKSLSFLKQLQQTCTLQEVTLGVHYDASNDFKFLDVENNVQQINHIRDTKGVSSQLKVKIILGYILDFL